VAGEVTELVITDTPTAVIPTAVRDDPCQLATVG